ncbi:hypothetical protein [Actinoplanes couchii]|uniref:YbaB/EbfC DNA-binding family protein n=1 Tax=Actinoplanes couchii TaxID=403638 RepID=A0ABQ3XGF7_9ACTN|nr:hypothetical protein [Actinoplanes couchii]MDR6321047.1 hypothetical protein [Actinoplanes couchii]GID57558.1 hypothetical protein Aco03nite_059620 [Actinoplanes couchii]
MSGETWLGDMQRLHQRADRFGRLAAGLTAAIPQRSEGCDPTGRVSVILDPAGLPVEITVRGGWEDRIEPEDLGAAVMGAYHDGVRQALRTWADRLDDEHWWRRQRDSEQATFDEPAVGRAIPSSGRVRDDAEFSEPVLRALHTAGDQPANAVESTAGADSGDPVVIRLGPGALLGCEIDPNWARPRDGATITAALRTTLTSARHRVADAVPKPDPGVDAALHDAWATLAALTGDLPDRGDR